MLKYPYGKVAEWLKAIDSKSIVGAILSRVQIPPFPQLSLRVICGKEKVANATFVRDLKSTAL